TQWNSTYYILRRFKEIQDELNLLKTAHPELESKPMLDATEILSKSSYLAIADIHLTFIAILQHINHFTANNSHLKEEYKMANLIKTTLNRYWTLLDLNESIKIATILDPISKLLTFPSTNEKEIAIANLQNIIAYTTSTSFDNKRKKFVAIISQQHTIEPGLLVAGELERYLSLLAIDNGSLQWWANNESRFLKLAKIAQDYLAIQSTNVPCEEAFSTAARTISKLHNRLSSKTARASLCLKSWMKNSVEV
ncbi:26244_t:CDS:2, partial [Dentiscutata erythropus]